MSLEMGLMKTRLIHTEDFLVLLLNLGCSGSRWMFSESDLSHQSLTVPPTGEMNLSPFFGALTLLFI